MDPKMTAETILTCVKNSNLNFSLRESPFSIQLDLKKTFIRNKNGEILSKNSDNLPDLEPLKNENKNYLKENYYLKALIDKLRADHEESKKALSEMNIKLEKEKEELELGKEAAEKELNRAKNTLNLLENENDLNLVENSNLVDKIRNLEDANKHSKYDSKKLSDENQKLKAEISLHKNRMTEVKNIKTSSTNTPISSLVDKTTITMLNFHHEQKETDITFPILASNLELDTSKIIMEDDEIVYNVETNNNFEALTNPIKSSTASSDDRFVGPRFPHIDQSNYKEFLKHFLEQYKEIGSDEPKYPEAVKTMMKHGHNIFHISLLDLGKFNLNLKGFIAAQQKNLSKEINYLVRKFGEGFDSGGFRNGLTVFINKKNYGQ